MNTKNKPSALLAVTFCLGGLVGCSTEPDDFNNPEPISPAPRASDDPSNSGSKAPNATFVASPAKAVQVPTKTCTVEIAKGETNSSGRDGATIALSESDTSQIGDLLFRIQSTESFVEVKEQIFNTAPYPAGSWIFEFYHEAGNSCLVPVVVTQNDVSEKIKITLKLIHPN